MFLLDFQSAHGLDFSIISIALKENRCYSMLPPCLLKYLYVLQETCGKVEESERSLEKLLDEVNKLRKTVKEKKKLCMQTFGKNW